MDRRSFIRCGAAFAAGMPLAVAHGTTQGDVRKGPNRLKGFAPLKVKRIRIEVGASAPFRAFHLSDTHIVRADVTENDPRKVELAASRYASMGFGEHYLDEAVHLARQEKALLLHTGDMIDFVSNANLRYAGLTYGSDDWFVAPGNHEFSRYVGEAREDAAYKAGSLDRVQANYPNDLAFAVRVVNGVNFVSFDDVYYSVAAEVLGKLEREVEKGLPIVLMCHVPFYTPKHYVRNMEHSHGVCSYLTGTPDELVDTWGGRHDFPEGQEWRDRAVQQRADASTKEFVRYVTAQKSIKAVLTGHCHEYWEERLSPTAIQYTAAATYKGECTAIEFV